MGLLGDVFSYGDFLKRRVNGLLSDPVGTVQQFVGNLGDQTNNNLALAQQSGYAPTVFGKSNATPQQTALARALLADQGAQQAMGAATVWHGSPHKFDKFDASKIGTGEGAQVYGHGLYLADSPNVAKEYIESNGAPEYIVDGLSVGNTSPTAYAAKLLSTSGTPPIEAINNARSLFSRIKKLTPEKEQYLNDAISEVNRLQQSGAQIQKGGSLYKVDLPDDQIAKMLDWDKPLSQQPDILPLITPEWKGGLAKTTPWAGDDSMTGQQLLNTAKQLNGTPQGASNWLKNMGIPGIRYLDGGSRGAGAGTSNYVIFPGNENMLTILERNGQPLNPLAAGLLK